MWIQWLLMFSCLFQGLVAITVLEFGDKPDENAKLEINIELPTSGFSLCFQMYLMQHTDNWKFAPLHFGKWTIIFHFTTTDFNLPSWITVFETGTSFVINEEILKFYQWTGLCLSVNETAFDVVMNGIQIGSWNRLDTIQTDAMSVKVSQLEFKADIRYKIANVNLWSQGLSMLEMKRLTEQCNISNYPKDDLIFALNKVNKVLDQLPSAKWTEGSSQDELCSISSIHYFTEVNATFDHAIEFCHSLGGSMYLPMSGKQLKEVPDEYADLWSWVPITYQEDKWVHVDSNQIVQSIPWNPGEPTNGKNEPCVALHKRKMFDISCSPFQLYFSCHFESIRKFIFRGLSKDFKVDQEYVIDHEQEYNNHVVFKGLQYGHWMVYQKQNSSWVILHKNDFPQDDQGLHEGDVIGTYTLGKSEHLPTGKHSWTILNSDKILKFTQCNKTQFTCSNGLCIDLEKKCDKKFDCLDESDEVSCKIIHKDPLMDNELPPPVRAGLTNISVNIALDSILDINEVKMNFKAKFMLWYHWFDWRIRFHDLKEGVNSLTEKETSQIWVPYLMFENGLDRYDGLSTDSGQSKTLVIIRERNNDYGTMDSLDEGRVYENQRLTYSSWFIRQFSCEFNLKHYPFDWQNCEIRISSPWVLQELVRLTPGESSNLGPDHFSQFNITNISMLLFKAKIDVGESNIGVMFQFQLQRDISHHIYMTYIPTLFILIMTLSSLFINEEHFQATTAVSMTCMLVLYMLYQSIVASMPITVYMKLLDYWLIFNLVMPFLVFITLVSWEIMKDKPTNQVMDIQENENWQRKKKYCKLTMQIILPSISGIFVLSYIIYVTSIIFQD